MTPPDPATGDPAAATGNPTANTAAKAGSHAPEPTAAGGNRATETTGNDPTSPAAGTAGPVAQPAAKAGSPAIDPTAAGGDHATEPAAKAGSHAAKPAAGAGLQATGAGGRGTISAAGGGSLVAADLLAVAVAEAEQGLAEGGIPIGAALFTSDGELLGKGHNRRVQDGDPSMHAETAAFRNAGRRRHYRDTIMVTTLSPCWYCSGLVRQFAIPHVIIGESTTFTGGHGWLAEHGVRIDLLDDQTCVGLMTDFIAAHPELWFEDIGE